MRGPVLYQRIQAVISRRASAKSRKKRCTDTLLLEAPNEPLDDPILLRRVGHDELFLQPIARQTARNRRLW